MDYWGGQRVCWPPSKIIEGAWPPPCSYAYDYDRLESALLHTCNIFQCSWLNGPLVKEKVFEMFILYMEMVASFGHETKLV